MQAPAFIVNKDNIFILIFFVKYCRFELSK